MWTNEKNKKHACAHDLSDLNWQDLEILVLKTNSTCARPCFSVPALLATSAQYGLRSNEER